MKALSCLANLTSAVVLLCTYTAGTSVNKCTRVCLALEGRFIDIFGIMRDGTPCPPTERGYNHARCIKGNCLVS